MSIESVPSLPPDRRAEILQGLSLAELHGLEIGPLCFPLVEKSDGDVCYVDYIDSEGLRAKYSADPNVDTARIVEVDALWGESTLAQATMGMGPYHYVVASHVIEHVPDLITWLGEVAEVLAPGGQLRLAIPDRRYSFDYYRNCSSVADVLTAHMERPRAPRAREVLDFILSHVDVPLDAAWRGEYPEPRTYSPEEWMSALSISRDLVEAGTYHDVHCWVFTPTHFIELMTHFAEMGLMQLKCDWVTNTRPGAVEFFASMSQSADAREALASWQEALTRVTPNSSPEELVADRVLTESEPKVPMDWIHTVGWEGLEITIKVAPR